MKVSAKRKDTGKFWNFGFIKTNQWGNEQLSFKVTPELIEFLREGIKGEWINFSLFPEDEPKEDNIATTGNVPPADVKNEPDLEDDPFGEPPF